MLDTVDGELSRGERMLLDMLDEADGGGTGVATSYTGDSGEPDGDGAGDGHTSDDHDDDMVLMGDTRPEVGGRAGRVEVGDSTAHSPRGHSLSGGGPGASKSSRPVAGPAQRGLLQAGGAPSRTGSDAWEDARTFILLNMHAILANLQA